MKHQILVALAFAVSLSACDRNREEILEGPRLDVSGAPLTSESVAETASRSITLPSMSANAEWTHRNGNASHSIAHPYLASSPKLRWSKDIGTGNTTRTKLSADPVIAGGRVFTLSADGLVTATSPSGALIWSKPLALQSDARHIVSGGGIAYGADTLFVTTGFGEVFSVNPATGSVNWLHKLNQTTSGAPVYSNGNLVVVSGNSAVTTLDVSNGRITWSRDSEQPSTGLLGTGGAAAAGRVTYVPFASGEVSATLIESGYQLWSQSLSGGRAGVATEFINAFSGEPVVTSNTVYVGTQAGKLTAINKRSGQRKWTINEGALSPVWPVGGSLFILSDQNKLKRLDASDGSEIWSATLPEFTNSKKQKGAIAHYGPVVAGGQVILAGSDGKIRRFDPTSGSLTGSIDIPDGAASNPAVAGGILYVLSNKGALHAFQ